MGLPGEQRAAALPAARAIRFDSRAVEAGDVFVCVAGERTDGHDFAAQAVARGAVALVAEQGRGAGLEALGVPVLRASDSRRALSAIAAAHEGYPAERLTVIGVTGTDGKSTTAFLTLAALEGCGLRAGLLSTIESRVAGQRMANPTRLTTQEAPFVQARLAEFVEAGCTHAVVEATSHGLALHRLDDCAFDVAVLTNFGSDHLDFHRTAEAYLAAKARLFALLDAPSTKGVARCAVLNADDPAWPRFAAATHARVLRYAIDSGEAELRIERIEARADGSRFAVRTDGRVIAASVGLPGRFNVANAAAALGVAAALGLDLERAAAGIAACPGVPGRMERIEGAPFGVVVDYAHTAAALDGVLRLLRPLVGGRLIVVFGCAGERSRERRAGMGRVAAERADFAIVTDEDPRSEPPDAIVGEIADALRAAGAREGRDFERVRPRGAAIVRAMEVAQPGDLVLVAGKGHESSIEWADRVEPWDDREAVRAAIAARFGDARSKRSR
jgi:UDP-N-acetylmuramoyl-L-alanyl-D-glutamate--2,6-diaminopimelate ligase